MTHKISKNAVNAILQLTKKNSQQSFQRCANKTVKALSEEEITLSSVLIYQMSI